MVHPLIELAHVGPQKRARTTHAGIRGQRIYYLRRTRTGHQDFTITASGVGDSRRWQTGGIHSAQPETANDVIAAPIIDTREVYGQDFTWCQPRETSLFPKGTCTTQLARKASLPVPSEESESCSLALANSAGSKSNPSDPACAQSSIEQLSLQESNSLDRDR